MFNTSDPEIYLERARMHEELADATDDVPARKIHQAMAAEYRRKAKEITADSYQPAPSTNPQILKLDAA